MFFTRQLPLCMSHSWNWYFSFTLLEINDTTSMRLAIAIHSWSLYCRLAFSRLTLTAHSWGLVWSSYRSAFALLLSKSRLALASYSCGLWVVQALFRPSWIFMGLVFFGAVCCIFLGHMYWLFSLWFVWIW